MEIKLSSNVRPVSPVEAYASEAVTGNLNTGPVQSKSSGVTLGDTVSMGTQSFTYAKPGLNIAVETPILNAVASPSIQKPAAVALSVDTSLIRNQLVIPTQVVAIPGAVSTSPKVLDQPKAAVLTGTEYPDLEKLRIQQAVLNTGNTTPANAAVVVSESLFHGGNQIVIAGGSNPAKPVEGLFLMNNLDDKLARQDAGDNTPKEPR